MNRTQRLEQLQAIFRDILDDETLEINEETSQDTLEDWDSLSHVTLFAVLEDEFSITFSLEETVKGTSVKQLLDYLDEKS